MYNYFASKADTLAKLEGSIRHASVLPQFSFTTQMWKHALMDVATLWSNRPEWASGSLIVRSSCQAEDSSVESLAGHYSTVANVTTKAELKSAINTVYQSFHDYNPKDQIFIQPMLENVSASGVAFTRDPSNGAYYNIVNYDDESASTDSVTAGTSNDLRIYYHFKNAQLPKKSWLSKLLLLLNELEEYFNNDALDIEFAVDQSDTLFLFQVRPLIIQGQNQFSLADHSNLLSEIEKYYKLLSKPHPYLLGQKSVFGVMPDWNPAEVIGIRPRPLALSLYKELITDGIWAYQRGNYGYRNLRSFPLIISFFGLPYIDVRVSFNSFIPSDLKVDLAERLVNYYIDCLLENPTNHDKVEFEILYSCYTLDLPQRILELKSAGFNQGECDEILESLKCLTNNIINEEDGLWKKDIAKLQTLKEKQEIINASELSLLEKTYWLLEDCKRYGTLPFAGLARAGFIAVQLLKSLVRVGILTSNEYECFMASLTTVSSDMQGELNNGKQDFLKKYGHLRPGTYNLLSHRYDESPDKYFDWNNTGEYSQHDSTNVPFSLNLKAKNRLESMLKDHGLKHSVSSFFNFIKGAIEGREYAKFVFTKSLSDALVLIKNMGEELDINVDDLSYIDINVVKKLYSSSHNIKESLRASIAEGKHIYKKTTVLTLPPLIATENDFRAFEFPRNKPNYITKKSTHGFIVFEDYDKVLLTGKILMIKSADPGYDWIFSRGIVGFITMYGGANSHMAIRSAELGIPAVIGTGEMLYRKWSKAVSIQIDCATEQVHILK